MLGAAPPRAMLRYFGSKWNLAAWIVGQLPAHRVYVEPFGGSAAVMMSKARSAAEVYNDLDKDLVNLFRVLRTPAQAKRLVGQLRLTPFSREEFALSKKKSPHLVEEARRYVVRSFMGRGTDSRFGRTSYNTFRANSFSRKTGGGGLNNHAEHWAKHPDHLAYFIERMAGVTVESLPAAKVLKKFDAPGTLFYLDPPYPQDVRRHGRQNYTHEMTNAEHEALAAQLQGIKGMAVLSVYQHPTYDALGWQRVEASAKDDRSATRVESLYFNPRAWAARPQTGLFEAVA